MNKIIVIGNLTRDTELRYSSGGLAITSGSIAVSEGYGDKQKTEFFNFTSFGKLAENMANLCKKGDKLVLEGKASLYEKEKDGSKIKYFQIITESFHKLNSKKETSVDDEFGF